MLLPVTSEMLLAHWSAAFVPPPQHEPASSAEGLTQACDQSIVALPVDGLRGRWGTQPREALERSLALSFLPARCTGSRSRCSSPCACQASQAQLVSGTLMCLTAFTKQVIPSSPSVSCLQLAMLFWSLPRAHPCCWVCSEIPLWVRSILPAVDPALFCVVSIIHHVSLDLILLCLCVSNPLFLSLTLLASCLWDRPSLSCSPC